MPQTLTPDQISKLADIADDLDLALRTDYSGRAMYGRTCIGFEGDTDMSVALLQLGAALAAADLPEIADTCRSDAMGLGWIVYFPSFQAPDGFVTDNEEECE